MMLNSRDPIIIDRRIYTHVDIDGVLWRFEGRRPISQIADSIVANMWRAMGPAYILKNKAVIPCDNLFTWVQWCEDEEWRVAKDDINGTHVSTIFIGRNHLICPNHADGILWETMVFGGPMDQTRLQCGGSYELAEIMHRQVVEKVREAQNG